MSFFLFFVLYVFPITNICVLFLLAFSSLESFRFNNPQRKTLNSENFLEKNKIINNIRSGENKNKETFNIQTHCTKNSENNLSDDFNK